MDAAEFDTFADEYAKMHRANIAITGEGPEYFAEYKIRLLRRFADEAGIGAGRIIDFGSGIGNSLPSFHTFFPQSAVTCADVSQRSLDLAEARFPGGGLALRIDEERIPADDHSFDVAFSACVFHHIPHGEHGRWLRELRRVTRPGGMLSIFEHNPLNPLTLRAVNTCPFDVNAHLLRAKQLRSSFEAAGWRDSRVRYHLFFPRALAALRPMEGRMEWLALGAQYSVTARN